MVITGYRARRGGLRTLISPLQWTLLHSVTWQETPWFTARRLYLQNQNKKLQTTRTALQELPEPQPEPPGPFRPGLKGSRSGPAPNLRKTSSNNCCGAGLLQVLWTPHQIKGCLCCTSRTGDLQVPSDRKTLSLPGCRKRSGCHGDGRQSCSWRRLTHTTGSSLYRTRTRTSFSSTFRGRGSSRAKFGVSAVPWGGGGLCGFTGT